MRTPTVECALRHLIDELYQQAYRQPHRGGNGEGRALMEAVWAREIHFIAVMVESEAETPDEYLAALIADGTLPADYQWPWDTKRPGAVLTPLPACGLREGRCQDAVSS